ncbi:MAG: hypothetical protein ABSG86_10240 [Thermoguttaceae bacterium]|jgi:hypothetical protein
MGTSVAWMRHYTDKPGYNSIRSQVDWRFEARQPPSPDHPVGAYFTDLPSDTPNLALKLRISAAKAAYCFPFRDIGDLRPIRGHRGKHIFYSPEDYVVVQARQGAIEELQSP